jgi:hypothetical protein
MNKIILALFSLVVLSFFACENEYDAGDMASKSDARIILTLIDARDVPYEGQRTFYDHTAKVVTVQVLPGYDWTTFTVYVSPVLYATMTPFGGTEQDWSSGSKTYTITSGDGTVTNTYTVRILEVAEFGNNNP